MTREPSPSGVPVERVDAADLLHQVLDTVLGGIFTVDPQGVITSWNGAMEEMTGFPSEAVIGRPCSVLQGDTCFGGATAPESQRCALFADGRIRHKRCNIRRRDGTPVPAVKNARLVQGKNGEVVGGIECLTDLSGVVALQAEIADLREQVSGRLLHSGLLGRDPAMLELRDAIAAAAKRDAPVLVQGETGTGKTLVARALHEAGPRAHGPYVRLSCPALTEPLLESELFGHVPGRGPDALGDREGAFEAADGGTLFLDEIAELSPGVQARLLRVLETGEIERPGDPVPRRVDVRVVAASKSDLEHLCSRGRFRRDLYERLATVEVRVPPLRERKSDLPLLVDHFVGKLRRALGRNIAGIAPATMGRLFDYDWPGNVRELEHAVEYGFVVARGEVIDDGAIPPAILQAARQTARRTRRHGPPDASEVMRALREAGGSRTRAAALLGVSRVTLWKWIKSLGLDSRDAAR